MLAAGTRLGPYQIVSAIGAGGMGQVYKARDTRLERDVAVKVLPPALADDPEFRARFEREARSISALDHPNICTLYDVGRDGQTQFLVMQYLDGETLAARIKKGPLPLDQALKIATEICGALSQAHRNGIIHRDLKPANVMLTRTSAARQAPILPKLLDFGLAKTAPLGPVSSAAPTELASPDHPDPLTKDGTILGTFEYMSPEQIEGHEADPRSDIWAFGCVLYEMLTGRRPFGGKTRASVMGAILKEEAPRIQSVQPFVPSALDHVVSTCLAKNPDDRWQSAADLARELTWIAETSTDAEPPRSTRSRNGERFMWIGSAVMAVIATAIVVSQMKSPAANDPAPTVHATLPLASDILPNQYPTFALSNDGKYLAYRAGGIYVRALAGSQSRRVDGTPANATSPFFSPDGNALGFFDTASRSIKRVALSGGAAVNVVDLDTTELRGAAWGDDGFIYYSPAASAGLWRISAGGGQPEELTTPDFAKGEKTHRFPFVLPGSNAVLFMVGTSRITSFDDGRIEALSLKTRDRLRLVDGGMYPQYAASGHLLYVRSGKLLAVPFDAEQLKINGSPVTVAEGMCIDTEFGFGSYAISRDGTLVRISGGAVRFLAGLLVVDRNGNSTPVPTPPFPQGNAGRVSSRGMLFAAFVSGATSQIRIVDLVRGTFNPLTFEWDNENAVWSPDGTRIIFSSNRGGGPKNLYSMRATDGGDVQRLLPSTNEQRAFSWAVDDNVAYVERTPETGDDIFVLSLLDKTLKPGIKTPANETAPAFSADGRWIAYHSDQSGRNEVYVQSYPSGADRLKVSDGGGNGPLWHPNGRDLIFRSGRRVMSAAMAFAPKLHAEMPVQLFDNGPDLLFDVLPDGRFLTRSATPRTPVTELEIVVNWFQELRNKMGTR